MKHCSTAVLTTRMFAICLLLFLGHVDVAAGNSRSQALPPEFPEHARETTLAPTTASPFLPPPPTEGPPPGPSIVENWRSYLEVWGNVTALEGLLLFTSWEEDYRAGGFTNYVQAVGSTGPGELWGQNTFGQVSLASACYAFSETLPNTLFVAGNNMQPPTVSAVTSASGEVMWTSSAAFRSVRGAKLTASLDGSIVYMTTTSPYRQSQLTAFAAASGALLFNVTELELPYSSAWCGSGADIPCLTWINNSATGKGSVLLFLHGLSGARLGEASLPLPSANLVGATITSLQPGLVLVSALGDDGDLIAVNTSDFSVAWQVAAGTPFPFRVQSVDAGAGKGALAVVIVISEGGVAGLSAATGEVLWNTTAGAVCPSAPPDVELSPAGAALGAFPSGASDGSLFSFVVNCSVPSGGGLLTAGAMSADDGSVFWWEWLDQVSFKFPIQPLGPNGFVLLGGARAAFYSANVTVQKIGSYPPSGLQKRVVDVWTTNATAFFELADEWYSTEFAAVEMVLGSP